ncbi:enoyl-CoA hydratase-related protein [Gordonia jinhuaensis]|uniref:Enoyl-coa hydratase/isomerase family protein n=1 Tax=Gordonia jinhuaensis TaxID=1517702 RepID=A0A916WN60_9ACTN|nr:enoyl-CoA hydratase/isomerase family protein [Gordonia jinhuaensis]GGB16795.1 putative enoyl-coa hydratase/isomerase family protein [Gordonia jinhuaensis]
MPYLISDDAVSVLHLGTKGVELDETNPENRFTPEWIEQVSELLTEAESIKPGALVITATGKFFTNGLDTDYVAAHPNDLPAYLDSVHQLYTRVLTLAVPTVTAVNGHAFGAGAMLALCGDVRVMRTERGFWSLPEVLLGMPFTAGMATLVRTRVPDPVATEAMTTGKRFGGEEAAAVGIVDAAVAESELVSSATALAGQRAATAGPNLSTIKRGLRKALLAELAIPTPPTLL